MAHLSIGKARFAGFILLIAGMLALGYGPEGSQFIFHIISWAIAFAGMLLIQSDKMPWTLKQLLILSLFFRIALLPSSPIFSDDVFRFLWDGYLLHEGVDPFSITPRAFINTLPANDTSWNDLFIRLNSPDYYSVYPPVKQLFFFAATALSKPGDIMLPILLLRLILILGEAGTLVLFWKVLATLKLPLHRISWYAFNPMVILEISGNMHFEGLVLLGLLFALWISLKNRTLTLKNQLTTSLGLAFSIGTKLTPLLLAPALVFRAVVTKKWSGMAILSILVGAVMSPLVFSMRQGGFLSSLDLYFRTFEFNASFYYVARYLGTCWMGYNPISITGPAIGLLAGILILIVSWRSRNYPYADWMVTGMWVYILWLLGSTTVHPWYLIVPLGLSLFSRFRFILAWSFTIFLSYHAYQYDPVQENATILALEYLPIFIWVGFEWWYVPKRKGV